MLGVITSVGDLIYLEVSRAIALPLVIKALGVAMVVNLKELDGMR